MDRRLYPRKARRMAPAAAAPSPHPTVADLLKQLGSIPPSRVLLRPAPGTATEQDVLDLEARENRLCELIDGVLVEKVKATYEARVAAVLVYFLERYQDEQDRGVVLGADGMLRLSPRQVRIPD